MELSRPPGATALAEILLMFSPALPAYLWLWPNVEGTEWYEPVLVLTYLYFLGGSLLIGLRRWNLKQLGLNYRGIGVSLLSGGLFIVGRTLAYISTNLPMKLQPFSFSRVVGEILFYFGLVGFIEEFLFRGLIYRALEDWSGTRLAIWGSALIFGIYHIGSQGILGGIGTAIIGLIFAVIRWRGGGNSRIGLHPWPGRFHRSRNPTKLRTDSNKPDPDRGTYPSYPQLYPALGSCTLSLEGVSPEK